ncbi:hypothetical protein N7523_008035 [Penicillium sp. IBT 18751x]|nr:hypothetical protein N7523_008035 [Penicillium sp. IBT 18751x]
MDQFTNSGFSLNEDDAMESSFLAQPTVRGNSCFGVSPFDMHRVRSRYPESLESSEHGYDPSNHAPTASSVTSYTAMHPLSSVPLPYDQSPPPGPVPSQDNVLLGITGGDQSVFEAYGNEIMNAELSDLNVDQFHTSDFPERNAQTSAMIGLNSISANVPHPTGEEHGIRQSLRDTNDVYNKILSHEKLSAHEIQQTKESLNFLRDHLDALARCQNSLPPSQPQVPPSSTGSLTAARYKCLECDKFETDLRGTFTRHVNDQHYPKCMFICPHCCEVRKPRKYQLRDHIEHKHKREVTEEELNACKRDYAPPAQCPLCSVLISSWKGFEECYFAHCSIAAMASRRTSIDQPTTGRDGTPSIDLAQPGPNPALDQAPSGFRSNSGAGGYPISVSRGNDPGPFLHPSRGNTCPNQGNASQPPSKRDSTSGHSHPALNRAGLPDPSARNTGPRSSGPRPALGCRRCSHKFINCQMCRNRNESTRFCHKCPDFSRILLTMARAHHGQDMRGPPQGQRMFINPAETQINQGRQAGTGSNQAMQGQFFSGNPQFRSSEYDPNGSIGPGFDGQQRNYQAMPVLDLDQPVFSVSEMAWPSLFSLKGNSLHGALLEMLPMVDLDPFKEWLCKPLQGLGSLALSGLDFVTQFDPPSSKIAMVNPDCQCKCACRAKARAELASGRKVEMKFKLRPVYRGTSHLRSRVEVVVKLLKLRSTVTESKAKREEAKSAITHALEPTLIDRTEEIPDYVSHISDEPDAESAFDEDDDDTDVLSTSSSYADLPSLVPTKPSSSTSPEDSSDKSLLSFKNDETEENSDDDILIEFNFDLGVAISKLEKWTGGSSMNIFSDMCVSDPGRLFEYLTAYILYVIMSLAHSRDHSSLRRLDN